MKKPVALVGASVKNQNKTTGVVSTAFESLKFIETQMTLEIVNNLVLTILDFQAKPIKLCPNCSTL